MSPDPHRLNYARPGVARPNAKRHTRRGWLVAGLLCWSVTSVSFGVALWNAKDVDPLPVPGPSGLSPAVVQAKNDAWQALCDGCAIGTCFALLGMFLIAPWLCVSSPPPADRSGK